MQKANGKDLHYFGKCFASLATQTKYISPGLDFPESQLLAVEFSISAAGKYENCAKLLKPNRGEVAERLNAAVC
jgi:hypothetical protein